MARTSSTPVCVPVVLSSAEGGSQTGTTPESSLSMNTATARVSSGNQVPALELLEIIVCFPPKRAVARQTPL